MNRRTKVQDDPVVEEVRAIRAKLWQEAGGTVEGLISLLDAERSKMRTTAKAKSKPARPQSRE